MKFVVLLTIGLVFAVPALSEAQQVQVPQQEFNKLAEDIAKDLANLAKEIASLTEGIVGLYECQGTNPDGTSYQGIVEIAKLGDTFRVLWTLSDQTQVFGVGILSNGVFAVSYWGGAPAVVVYRIDGDRLVGEWTMGGLDGQTYSEVLTKLEGHPEPSEPQKPTGLPVTSPQRQARPIGVAI